MLRFKGTTKISEFKNFFNSSEASVQTLFSELCALNVSGRMFRHKALRNLQICLFNVKPIVVETY
jgi:hypothetical protein